jgi:hypothetical protein
MEALKNQIIGLSSQVRVHMSIPSSHAMVCVPWALQRRRVVYDMTQSGCCTAVPARRRPLCPGAARCASLAVPPAAQDTLQQLHNALKGSEALLDQNHGALTAVLVELDPVQHSLGYLYLL